MSKIVIGLIVAYIGHCVYNAALTTIKNELVHTGKTELKSRFIIIFGLILAIVGGVFIGGGLIKI